MQQLPEDIRRHLCQKADADEEGEEQGKAAQHHVAHDEGHIAAHRAHGQDARQHDPAVFQVNEQ